MLTRRDETKWKYKQIKGVHEWDRSVQPVVQGYGQCLAHAFIGALQNGLPQDSVDNKWHVS